MKKSLRILSIFMACFGFNTNAQIIEHIYQGNGGSLKSNNISYLESIDSIVFLEPNIQQLRVEDSISDIMKDGPWRFGYNNSTNLNVNNSGTWVDLPNGDRIWFLRIKCINAQTINLTLTNTNIPEGCELYFYNEDKSFILGKFSNEHTYNGELGTELIPGGSVVVEYFIPSAKGNNFGNFDITKVTHGYRGSNEFIIKAFGQSPSSCKVNVNCPEGIVWSNQRNSAIMLVSGGNGFCSGALVNNTLNDGKPYVLTSATCGTNPTSWVFRFNWQSSGCANPQISPNFSSLSGAILRASNTASNFCLVEITGGLQSNTVPQSFNPFFSGWDNSGATPNGAFSIQHPFGDIKKISFENENLISSNWSGTPSDSYWVVPNWNLSNMDGGSTMGAPLFNTSGLLIGQYHGGQSFCGGTNGSDWFGKFSYSWNPPASNSTNQLKYWLDPNNLSVSILNGYNSLPHVYFQQSITACDSITLYGSTKFSTGWYVDTLYGVTYDSIFVTNLTINNSSLSSLTMSTCDNTLTLPSGISVTANGVYTDLVQNIMGCDSIITIDVTFLQPSYNDIYPIVCNVPYLSESGNQYFASGIYNDTIQNYLGCDSIITIHLTVLNSSINLIYDTICGGAYSWNNQSYNSSGIYIQTFQSANGCDSIVTLNLIVNPNNFNPTFFSNQQLFTSPPFAVQFSNTTVNPGNYNFTWYWGDGTSTTSNNPTVFHQYLNNGLFSVTLEATNIITGCSDDTTFIDYIFTTGGVACTHAANIYETGPITACSGQSVILTCNSSPGFTYQWRKNGIYVSGNNNDTLIVTQPGTYSVIITENGCPVSSSEIVVNFSTITTPVITSVGIIQPCIGGSVTLNATPGFTSYLWSNGDATPTTTVIVSGNYTVQVTNASGCSSTSNAFTINASILPIQNLCIIGVDSASNNLRVVWEKPISIAIDSFYIYKESNVSNIYTQVGARHYDSLSVWIDPISNPAVQAYRYKITALDTCGTETPLSDFHKSIHLTINQGVGGAWNLIWSHYEGLTFGSYNIYRGSDPLNMSLLTTIQSNLNSYTDLTPPVGPVYYQIEIVNPNNCDPTKVINYNVSKSNIVNNGVGSTAENIKDFKVFPNPTDNILYIQSTEFLDNTIIIFDAQGRKVLAGKLTGTTTTIDISKLAAGNYLVQVGEKQLPVRIVKN